MKKSAILLILFMLFNKAFGLVREMTLSYFYGTGVYAESFILANQIPTVIFGFVSAGITASIIPMYSKIKETDGENNAGKFLSNFTNILSIMLIAATILGLLFTNTLVKIFAVGFTGTTLEIAIQFTKITLLGIIFTGLMSILNGYLQVKNHFLTAPIAAFFMNIVTITAIVVSSKTDPLILAVGSVLATLIQFLVTYYIAKRASFKHEWNINIKDENIKVLLFMALPVIFGSSVDQINQIVDKTMASNIMPGAIAMINYAGKISDSVLGLFVTSVATVFFPLISRYAAQGKIEALKNEIASTLNSVFLLVIPASVGFVIFSTEIVTLFYGRGKFDQESILMTGTILVIFSIGNIAYASRQIFTRIFYALHDSRTPLFASVSGVAINIILIFILSKIFGLPGLAMSTTIAAYSSVGILMVALRKKIGSFGISKILVTTVKIMFASVIMGFMSYFINAYLIQSLSSNLSLMISILAGVMVYTVIILFLKIEEVNQIVSSVKNRLHRAR